MELRQNAAVQLLGLLHRSQTDWNDTATIALRKRFRALTGLHFPSFAELQKWWLENNDYLVWSDAEKHLAVDEAAKSARTPIAPLNPVQNTIAERYWFFEGMGWLKNVKNEGPYLLADAWNGEQDIRIRVLKTDLAPRKTKQEGYRQAVKTVIADRLTLPELGEEGARELIQRLQTITGENFKDRDSWISWWKTNGGHLILSNDEQRLIVRNPSR